MKTRLIKRPGQRGTKSLIDKYGDQLVCVRYRYDEEKKKRYKTVELIIEEKEWAPDVNNISKNKKVFLKVGIGERDVQRKIKMLGGKWDPKQKLWQMIYKNVLKLGMEDRVVG